MKKACLVLVLLTSLIACEKPNNEPSREKLPLKSITSTSPAGSKTATLAYTGGNQLTSYSTSDISIVFTYNHEGLPSMITETAGSTKTEYTIHYNVNIPDWASSRVNQNNVWTDGPDYEYTVNNGSVTELSRFIKGTQIKTGSIVAEYQSHFLLKAVSTIPGNQYTKTYTYYRDAFTNTSRRINLLTPNIPAHLISLCVANKEVSGNTETTFTFGY